MEEERGTFCVRQQPSEEERILKGTANKTSPRKETLGVPGGMSKKDLRRRRKEKKERSF